MQTLHDYLQTYLNELQQLLNAHPDDEALIQAVREKWPDKDDLRREFVIACQGSNFRHGGLFSIKDMGGEDNEGRGNEPVGKAPIPPVQS